ncbi:hypothetical protein NIES4071_23460 [Calothrix sp. NIES-4071]|nr:hypothetical protein NIES4071_23460 [Calothrix sp. NIES-4071]BAZ56671.1 hypothetical protein NIES4105_23410 [Calothrix sp. NIES-4105]
MTDSPEILSLLSAERDRYILEALDLERRLSFIRHQINSLEGLISGYAQEDQMYHPLGGLSSLSSTQAYLQDSSRQFNRHYEAAASPIVETTSSSSTQVASSTAASNLAASKPKPDISDIPKLHISRKASTIPLLTQYQDYSVQNAILILMRHNPTTHFHVDAIVRDLYGDGLDEEQFKIAKATVSKMLSTGTQARLWYRVLHTQGVYTLTYEKGVTSKPPKGK